MSSLHIASEVILSSRKRTLLANNAFALTAALLMGLSHPTGVFELLVAGRLLTGINAGQRCRNVPLLDVESVWNQNLWT